MYTLLDISLHNISLCTLPTLSETYLKVKTQWLINCCIFIHRMLDRSLQLYEKIKNHYEKRLQL